MVLVFSTKYMIFSVTETSTIFVLIASIILFFYFSHKKFIFKKGTLAEQLGLLTFFISFFLFNISKFFGELNIANAIIPTGLILSLMILVPFFSDKETLKRSLHLYSKFNSLLLLIGLIIFFLSIIGLVHSDVLVHASDHANPEGYVSLFGVAYYPSWFKINLGSLSYYRFTGAFWEPGTLGLYLVVLITIEVTIFYNQDSQSKYRIGIYLLAGLASLSMLFICAMFILLSIMTLLRINNKKYLSLFCLFIVVTISLCVIYYDDLYKLVLYRFDFDSQRGFVGNNRSGVISLFLNQFANESTLQQIIGAGPYTEFDGDPTSFIIKIFQRGILGFLFLFSSFLFFCMGRQNKFILPAWLFSLAILCQFEGAIFLLMLATLSINSKFTESNRLN